MIQFAICHKIGKKKKGKERVQLTSNKLLFNGKKKNLLKLVCVYACMYVSYSSL